MRNEKEVMKQILDFAQSDNRVRAVMLNGSRVNQNAPKDIMQDYDVVFFVRNIKDMYYKNNREWIKQFGKLVMLQQNDFENGYIFLMQFKDGVRIDLCFNDVKYVKESTREDSLSMMLMDKDDLVDSLPLPSDQIYHVKKPTKKEFDKVLNNAWWIQTYVAKGIWRDELPLVKYMFDVILMNCIRNLLKWHIGNERNWNVNPGKLGKWFKNFLPEELYIEFIALYPGTNYDEMWDLLFKAGQFVRKIGANLAQKLDYTYPLDDDNNVTEFIHKIKVLPKEAKDFD